MNALPAAHVRDAIGATLTPFGERIASLSHSSQASALCNELSVLILALRCLESTACVPYVLSFITTLWTVRTDVESLVILLPTAFPGSAGVDDGSHDISDF